MKYSLFIFLISYFDLIHSQSQGPNSGSVTSNTAIALSNSTTSNRKNVFISDNLLGIKYNKLSEYGQFFGLFSCEWIRIYNTNKCYNHWF